MSVRGGPWILFEMPDGRRLVYTEHEETPLRTALEAGMQRCCLAYGRAPVRAEMTPADWDRLISEFGGLARYEVEQDGSRAMHLLTPDGLIKVVGSAAHWPKLSLVAG